MSAASTNNRTFLLVVVLAIALSIPWLGRPFHTRGEPREALVAQAMLVTGNWISPPAYDGAVPSKPPFSHWLIALASLPSGAVSEATARLPSAFAFVIFSAALFRFLARRTNEAAAFTSGVILLSCSEWFRAASTCRVDTILATSMAGSLLAFFAWWERGYRGVPVVAIVLTVCSALTKGPVGIVLPLGIFSFFCWLKAEFRLRDLPPIIIRAVCVALPVLVIVSSWYVMGYLQRGDEFLAKIRYENFERFTSSMQDEPHKHSALYLFGMLGLGLLPWTVFVCAAALRNRSRIGLSRSTVAAWWRQLPALYQFAWLVTVSIVLFFCIPSSKRSVYLLPAYPFMAVLLQRLVMQGYETLSARMARIVVWGVILIGVVWASLLMLPVSGVSFQWGAFLESLSLIKVASVLGIVAVLVGVLREEWGTAILSSVNRLAIAIISAVFLISCFVYDTAAHQLSERSWLDSPQFRGSVDLSQVERLYSFGSEAYGSSFYLEKPFSRATAALPPGAIVFVQQRNIDELNRVVGAPLQELARHSSGLEKPSRDLVVVRILPR
jgi:4-amino-4-deoxy-L-arabinose transferase-like glycosyltransferase